MTTPSNTNHSSQLTDIDLQMFSQGKHYRLFDKMGAHACEADGSSGVRFAVWAPNATQVYVIGDFNGWSLSANALNLKQGTGIWDGFIQGVAIGSQYKFHIVGHDGYRIDKSDPFAFSCQVRPETSSIVTDLRFAWHDNDWMRDQASRNSLSAPISIYEMHLGSWRQKQDASNRFYSYRELAQPLTNYLVTHGFTHVEFLPLMEHPYYGSWGYQMTGFFAPTSCYGSPQDLMFLIDTLHQNSIGVILDWVPSHFPCDAHGLGFFDGTHLYEHPDRRLGFHPDWGSNIFNYENSQVTNFLVNSALFWLEKYHVDGIRVDAVASMLYLDYSRKEGEWVPNRNGGRENLEAIAFIKCLNEQIYSRFPKVQTFAEESTAWPDATKPTYSGGLGFGYKWDMGWMHDTLKYMAHNPIDRKHHHGELVFRSVYANSENFVLSLSHDDVAKGKKSLLEKMPGNRSEKFANLRLLLGYMYTQTGKKLLFMGDEFGQVGEWDHESSLEWNLLERPEHSGIARWVGDLNRTYRTEGALHIKDCDPTGFRWVEANDSEQSVFCYLRFGGENSQPILVALNFTPVLREGYRVGVPCGGTWSEIMNSDSAIYGGSGAGNFGSVQSVPFGSHGQSHSLCITIPPLSMIMLKSANA